MGRSITWLIAAAALTVVLAGCANTPPTAGTPSTDPNGAAAMVIEVSVGGGLVLPAVRVGDSLPRVWIAADGRYLHQTSAPGDPALITLEERRIRSADLDGLVEDARAVGLLAENPDFGSTRIADAMVTRVVVVADGTRHEVLVPALGYPDSGLGDDAVRARARLSEFLDLLQNPERIAGVSGASDYAPTAVAVFVLGPASAPAGTPPATWPLGDPGTAGTPTDWPDRSARCLVITGDDLAAVVSAAAGKNRFTAWRSGDRLWDIALRPLLPDERSCDDVSG